MQYEVVLKTNMREAFENIKLTPGNQPKLTSHILKSLTKGIGLIRRKRMWAVIRG